MKFRYVPAIGARVKLARFENYTAFSIHVWAWLLVLDTVGENVGVEVLNGDQKTGRQIVVPLSMIEKPLGWQERYEIVCPPERVDEIMSWLPRGIAVRQSHNLSGSMPTAFQPLDNSGQTHWQFCELTDIIPPELTDLRVQIVERVQTMDVQHNGVSLARMTRAERTRARAAMTAEGFEVFYDRHNGIWWAVRETVVKPWAANPDYLGCPVCGFLSEDDGTTCANCTARNAR